VRATVAEAGTATVLFPGTIAGLPAYTVKVHAKFAGQTPAIRGVLCVHDKDTGALLAIMDSTYVTGVPDGHRRCTRSRRA
jgi:ornithine cyclodeaminase